MVVDGWHHALGHQFSGPVEPAVGAAGEGVDRRPRADGAVVMLDDLHVTDGQLGKADLAATTPAVGDFEEVDSRPVGAVDARGGPPGIGRQRPPTVLGFGHRLVAGLVAIGVLVETDQRGRHAEEQVGAAVVLSPPDDLIVVGVDAVVLVSGEPTDRTLVARSPGGDHSRPASLAVGEHTGRIDGVVLARLTISAGLFGHSMVVICWLGCPRGVVATGASSCGELTRESPPRSAEAVDRRHGRERRGAASLRDNPAAPAWIGSAPIAAPPAAASSALMKSTIACSGINRRLPIFTDRNWPVEISLKTWVLLTLSRSCVEAMLFRRATSADSASVI